MSSPGGPWLSLQRRFPTEFISRPRMAFTTLSLHLPLCVPAGSHPPPHACVVLRMLSCVLQCALCRTGCFLETFPILSCSAALLSLQGILIGRHSGVLSLVCLKPNCRSLQVGGARFHERGPYLSRGLSRRVVAKAPASVARLLWPFWSSASWRAIDRRHPSWKDNSLGTLQIRPGRVCLVGPE